MTETIEIRPDSEIATLINVFVVEPDNQVKLIQVLKNGAETLMSKHPGYISASFHKSLDGRRADCLRSLIRPSHMTGRPAPVPSPT